MWGSSGSKPVEPLELYFAKYPRYDNYRIPVQVDRLYQNYYNSIKQELTDKFNLADLAIGTFRMTEQDVKKMVAWGDGSRVAELLEQSQKKTYWCLGMLRVDTRGNNNA